MVNLQEKSLKWLKKAIKQIHSVICVFQYPYFWDEDADFEQFRNDVLYRLIDQWKKMEAELAARRGRL